MWRIPNIILYRLLFLMLCITLLTPYSAQAALMAFFESPEDSQTVSGATLIYGWTFDSGAGIQIASVELFIDGVRVGDIPCCSERGDVQAAFPELPADNTLNSGWGLTFNWGLLSEGEHTIQVEIQSTAGEVLSTETRTVFIVKPGDFEFVDQFDVSSATASIDGDELVLQGVVVRDKATQQQKEIDASFRWFRSSQALGMVEAITTTEFSSLPSLFSRLLSSLSQWFRGVASAAGAHAAFGIMAFFEDPEENQVGSGASIIHGWAFPEEGASITEVQLLVDGEPVSTAPCCSERGDVAIAFPENPNALQSGWGITFNYGLLTAGLHTLGVRIIDSTGASRSFFHRVTVVKPGGFEFLDDFDISRATARIEEEDIVLKGVWIQDKTSQQRRVVDVRLRWSISAQALRIVQVDNVLNLHNKRFLFSDGGAFHQQLLDVETRLTFGAFVGYGGPFTLMSEVSETSFTADGDVSIGIGARSCTFDVTTSTFPAGLGPQIGDQISMDPCETDELGINFLLTSVETGLFSQGTEIAKFTLATHPGDSLLLRAETGDGDIVEYIGEKDDSGTATALKAIRVESADGNTTTIRTDDQARLGQILLSDGTSLNLNLLSETLLEVTFISSDGLIEVSETVELPSPIEGSAALSLPIQLPALESPVTISQGTTTVSVDLEDCIASPVNGAQVSITVRDAESGKQETFLGRPTGNSGKYNVDLPTESVDIPDVVSACKSVIDPIDFACAAINLMNPALINILCTSIATAVEVLDPIPGDAAVVLPACLAAFNSAKVACGLGGPPGSPSPGSLFCEELQGLVNRNLEEKFGRDIFLKANGTIPGRGGTFTTAEQMARASGPFSDFTIEACNGPLEVTITSPSEGEVFSITQDVSFAGSAVNKRGSKVSKDFLDWFVDGFLFQSSDDAFTAGVSVGDHTVTLRATDILNEMGTASVPICVADRPVARDDSASTKVYSTTTFNVLANDTNPDQCGGFNPILRVTGVDTFNTIGQVTWNTSGQVTYDPRGRFENLEEGESAVDSFEYFIPFGFDLSDGKATVRIIVADPTFIQPSRTMEKHIIHPGLCPASEDLFAKISVPYEDALVRADVPIFGLACGEKFKEHRLEYGEGPEPADWTTIAASTSSKTKNVTPDDLDDSFDITIHGNLATWDTGLKTYVYLPSHPKDHPTDLKGTYTLRLVVIGIDGSIVEDRVKVDVANVIPNAWGGQAISEDRRVTLSVPEQALMDSFRLILLAVENAPPAPPPGRQIIGNIYEAREAGEWFTKEAELQFAFSREELGQVEARQLGIYAYNPRTEKWEHLRSIRRDSVNAVFTKIRELYPYYALMTSDLSHEGSTLEPAVGEGVRIQQISAAGRNGHFLIQNTFEDGLGEWSNRDGDVGADVILDHTATFDDTQALKIINTHAGGNFAVNVRTTPFDAREYPVVQFDYRIPPEVKTNFLVKVSGRWYEVGFTDDWKELRNKRVNIAHIGQVSGVVADDKWHTAQFNLYDMLQTKTGHTLVEEMIMADWDVGGYMKLQFGQNREGATYYIDNFAISREISAGLRVADNTIFVDHFNQKKETNILGGATTIFSDARERGAMEEKRLEARFSEGGASGKGYGLTLTYDLPQAGNYAVYASNLQNIDLRGHHALTFFLKSEGDGSNLLVGLKDRVGREQKVPVSTYLSEKHTAAWQQVTIPLTAFSSELDWSGIDNLSLSFEHALHPSGTVVVDDIAFHRDLGPSLVDAFENTNQTNLLGGKHWTFTSGVASINGSYAKGSSNGIYRISYGGNIGEIKAYASDLFTYAGWTTDLGGIDCSHCDTVSFRIRGAEGGEKPNIYLDDSNFRWGVDIGKYTTIMTEWQTVTIPLQEFADYGVDLTHLAELQVVFEWEKMSGTIYLDDIRLE